MPKKIFDADDDNHLFRAAVDEASPHRHDKAEPFRPPLRPHPLPPNPAVTGDTPEQQLVDLPIETGDILEFVRPGVQNRLFQELRRGRLPPEEMLDLHGLRVAEARRLLADPAWVVADIDATHILFLRADGPNALLARRAAITQAKLDVKQYIRKLEAMSPGDSFPVYLGASLLSELYWDTAAVEVIEDYKPRDVECAADDDDRRPR